MQDRALLPGFLQTAWNNGRATAQNMADAFARLDAIHRCFTEMTEGISSGQHIICRYFLLRCHSSFLAACNLACCTQLSDGYGVMRLVLENALYAVFLSRHPDLIETWLNRQDSDECRNTARNAFKAGAMMRELDTASPDLGPLFRKMYEETLDLGAHPNVAAILAHTDHEESAEGIRVTHSFLNPGSPQLDLALKTLARCGVIALDCFVRIWPGAPEMIQLKQQVDALKQGL